MITDDNIYEYILKYIMGMQKSQEGDGPTDLVPFPEWNRSLTLTYFFRIFLNVLVRAGTTSKRSPTMP
jgi:hypothetical protein